MRLLLLLMLTLLITPVVSAAVIQGKIYDLELNRLDNVVVEIDTIPRQRVISQNGEYFFSLFDYKPMKELELLENVFFGRVK